MGRVRAKFRAMEISRHWNGKLTEVRLLPVYGKRKDEYPDDPGACEENAAFWDATPSGEASVRYGTVEGDKVPFKLGRCYYVDMVPSESVTRWQLKVNSQYETQLDIELNCKWDTEHLRTGSIKMSIGNEGAWPAFQDAGPGSFWTVEFTEAEG
jgi:hypothetical protein